MLSAPSWAGRRSRRGERDLIEAGKIQAIGFDYVGET